MRQVISELKPAHILEFPDRYPPAKVQGLLEAGSLQALIAEAYGTLPQNWLRYDSDSAFYDTHLTERLLQQVASALRIPSTQMDKLGINSYQLMVTIKEWLSTNKWFLVKYAGIPFGVAAVVLIILIFMANGFQPTADNAYGIVYGLEP